MASLLWDTAILNIDFKVKVKNILLPKSLKEDPIAKKIYLEQISENWSGRIGQGLWASETKLICEDWKIKDCNLKALNKDQYKLVLIQAGHNMKEN